MDEDIKSYVNNLPTFDLKDSNSLFLAKDHISNTSNVFKVKNEDGSTEVAVAVVVPRDQPAAISYLEEVKDYSDTNKSIYDQIALSRKLYLYETIVGTVIDLFSDFSCSKFKVENVDDEKALKLINFFLENVNMGNNNMPIGIHTLARYYALEFYIAGNVFPYSKWSKTYVDELKGNYKLPMSLVNLDPMIIDIPEEYIQFGNKKIFISSERAFGKNAFKMTNRQKDRILKTIPTTIRNKFKNNQDYELNEFNVYHMKRKGTSYSGWGKPYLTRAFTAVAQKRRLRALDSATIEGLINSITIFKIGDPDHKETWSPTRVTAFKRLLANPSASMQIVCAWDCEVDHIGPEGDILQFADRYKSADKDILYALGVPDALLTGEGNRAGDVWASIRFLIERMAEPREEYKLFIEDILLKIMQKNGFDKIQPKIRYYKPSANREDIRNILIALYDRGLISKETLLEESGFDKNGEVTRRKNEKKDKTDDVLSRPDVPFSPTNKNNKTSNPNPQSNIPVEKTNVKKQTKMTEVNQKEVKVTPQMKPKSETKANIIFEELIDTNKYNNINEFMDDLENNVQIITTAINGLYELDLLNDLTKLAMNYFGRSN